MKNSIFQLFDPLAQEEYENLKKDIANRGIIIPIEEDENGMILDGHHRIKAWQELKAEGIKLPDYPRIVRGGMTDKQKRNHIRALNILRRHLTKKQMHVQMKDMRKDGATYQKIAQTVGMSIETARHVTSNELSKIGKLTGADGKKRPAKYKCKAKPVEAPIVSIFASNKSDENRAKKAAEAIGNDAPSIVLTTKRAARLGRENENSQLREKDIPQKLKIGNIDIRYGDFRSVLSNISDSSVGMILTDPPYGKSHLSQWADLAIFAVRVLKSGGILMTYSGQSYLPIVMDALGKHLNYIWIIAQLGKGPKTIIHDRHFYSSWKPMLVYAKESYNSITWVDDITGKGGAEKNLHDWQQAEKEAIWAINSFSKNGELIVDPFLGGGTTAVAAYQTGHPFIGCDIDKACIGKSRKRLNEQI